jgi:hypothetical protein
MYVVILEHVTQIHPILLSNCYFKNNHIMEQHKPLRTVLRFNVILRNNPYLVFGAVYSRKSRPTFQRCVLSLSSGRRVIALMKEAVRSPL